MKKLLLSIALISATFFAFSQNVGVNSTGALPNNSAGLDIDYSDKGLLIPRVSLTSTTDVVTIPAPATSLLVYNTNAAMTGGAVGFWYFNGSAWVQAIGPAGPAGPAGAPGAPGAPGVVNPIVSVSMTGDQTMTDTVFTNVPALSLNYTPTKGTVFVSVTISGFAFTLSNSIVEFRILVNGVSVGGMSEKAGIDNTWDGVSSIQWSVAFTKMVTVNTGINNTFVVQYRTSASTGTTGVRVFNLTEPGQHGTLSVFD